VSRILKIVIPAGSLSFLLSVMGALAVMRTLSKCGAVVLPVNSVGEDMAITDTLLFYLRMCTVLCKYSVDDFINHFSGPGRAVGCVCVCVSVCLRDQMIILN